MMSARIHTFLLCMATVASPWAYAQEAAQPAYPDFLDMPLQDLLSMEVTSASKKTQMITDTNAAVFVITDEDIRRSGVTNLPDALRMVPGIQVAQLDSNKWAVSSRGFNMRFSHHLLVMIDGRTIYSPMFSGVYWDQHNLIMEDIDRIEVIRGPGGTLWGANAMNGVINIITKRAEQSQGGMVNLRAGNQENGAVQLRYGGAFGDGIHYRAHGQFFDRNSNHLIDQQRKADDDWQGKNVGMRVDFLQNPDNQVSIQFEGFNVRAGETRFHRRQAPLTESVISSDTDTKGFVVSLDWARIVSEKVDWQLRTFYDQYQRDWATIGEKRRTWDIDFQIRSRKIRYHDIVMGANYRQSRDEIENTPIAQVVETRRTDELSSVFVQDEIEISPDFYLTVGSKLEHNEYTGYELQPSVRALFHITPRDSLWASVSRAVSLPVRGFVDSRLLLDVVPAFSEVNVTPFDMLLSASGDGGRRSESVVAYELGYRIKYNENISVDTAIYYNKYDDLLTLAQGTQLQCTNGEAFPACAQKPGFNQIVEHHGSLTSGNDGRALGAELAVDWQLRHNLNLNIAYNYMDMETESFRENGELRQAIYLSGSNPKQQLSTRITYQPRNDFDVSAWVRYVDELDEVILQEDLQVPAYTELDLHMNWQPTNNLTLSLTGRNLLEKRHLEFSSELSDLPPVQIERSWLAKLQWQF